MAFSVLGNTFSLEFFIYALEEKKEKNKKLHFPLGLSEELFYGLPNFLCKKKNGTNKQTKTTQLTNVELGKIVTLAY